MQVFEINEHNYEDCKHALFCCWSKLIARHIDYVEKLSNQHVAMCTYITVPEMTTL